MSVKNEIYKIMDEIDELNVQDSITSMGQLSTDWKERVTSSVLSNFISTSSSINTIDSHECYLNSCSQGYLPFDKYSKNVDCAKDISADEQNVNKSTISFGNWEDIRSHISSSVSHEKYLGARTRRHTWTSTNITQKENSLSSDDLTPVRKFRSFPCLSDNHFMCCYNKYSSSSFATTCKNHNESHEIQMANSCNNLNSSISSFCSQKCICDMKDNKDNFKASHSELNCSHFDSIKSNTELLYPRHIFCKPSADIFITNIINKVQKFTEESNSFNCNLTKFEAQFDCSYNSVYNHTKVMGKAEVLNECSDTDSSSNSIINYAEELSPGNKNKSIDQKCDTKKRKEIKQLYDSLREMKWAHGITAKSLRMESNMRRQSTRIARESNNKRIPMSATIYKRFLPNRNIRKIEGTEKRTIGKKKQFLNSLNLSELLSVKQDAKSVSFKPKDKFNSRIKKLESCKKIEEEKNNLIVLNKNEFNAVHQNELYNTCVTNNNDDEECSKSHIIKQNLIKEKISPLLNKTTINVKKSVSSNSSSTFNCNSSEERINIDADFVMNKSRKNISSVSYNCQNSYSKLAQNSCQQNVNNNKNSNFKHQNSDQSNKSIITLRAISSSKCMGNDTSKIADVNCMIKTGNKRSHEDSKRNSTCDKDVQLTFGKLRIQGSHSQNHHDPKIHKDKLDKETNHSKLLHREFTLHYKGITVKRNSSYTQIIFKLNGRRQKFLSIEDMIELKETLEATVRDPNCKVLLLSGTDNQFCSGLDLQPILHHKKERMVDEMARAVKELVETLATFSKPLVIAVNGCAMGLGVTLLTYSDVVLASDNATFSMPYSQLGYMPEGAGTLMLPQVMGVTMAADMLIRGQQLTAYEAHNHGLVSEVVKQNHLMTYVIPRVLTLAKQPLQAMEATKSLMRCHLWEKLQFTLEKELQLLPRQWLSMPCQQAVSEAYSNGFFAN